MLGKFRRGTLLPVIVSIMIILPPSLAEFEPDDPYWDEEGEGTPPNPEQWAPKRIDIPKAWDLTDNGNKTVGGSRTILVAVLDTGVDFNHDDLENRIWQNINDPVGDADSNGNPDDDGNGYIDDYQGWNFVDGDNNVMDYGIQDQPAIPRVYHGTMIAGIISATIDNSEGIAGAAEISIMPIKVCGNGALGQYSTMNPSEASEE